MNKNIKFLLLAIPFLFLIGSLIHFLYEFSNENFFIGLISPINESIWEHTKLSLYPLIIYWIIFYLFNSNDINKNNYFFALLVTLITYIILIPMLYYFYTGSFGFQILFVDILILLISLALSHFIGIHIYNNSNINLEYKISVFIIILILLLYILLTINPPELPLFYDKSSDSYGLKK